MHERSCHLLLTDPEHPQADAIRSSGLVGPGSGPGLLPSHVAVLDSCCCWELVGDVVGVGDCPWVWTEA